MGTTTAAARGNVRLDAGTSGQIEELATEASALLDLPRPAYRCQDAASAKQVLAWVWERTMAQLANPTAATGTPPITRLAEFLARVRRLEALVDEARVAESVEMMRRIRHAVARVDDASTVDELLAHAAEEACTLGFDRVAISTVAETSWQMHRMVIEKDRRLAEEMLAVSREKPPMLEGSVESDVVTTQRPVLALSVQENPRVNRQLVSLSGSISYGVAPLTVEGTVLGLLHGDKHYPRREVDMADLAILNLFASGISQTLSRVSVLQRVAALRDGMSHLIGGVRAGQALVLQHAPAFSAAIQPAQPEREPEAGPLTGREIDVIELMAKGRGNLAIADELCISEGTVKTHITHILRKLDANNRAEAVAYWLRR